MRLRKFTAPDIASAMKMVRDDLGEDAIILHTAHGRGNSGVSVTAAIDENTEFIPQHPAAITSAMMPKQSPKSHTDDLKRILRFNNTPEMLVSLLLEKDESSKGDLNTALTALLRQHFNFYPLPLTSVGFRFALIGTPGIGKTLTVAKIAAQLKLEKFDVQLITTDTARAGGIEQLKSLADVMNVPVHVARDSKQLWQHLQEMPKNCRVIIDTAGCNPYLKAEMDELNALINVGGFEPVLAMPAGMDASEALDVTQAFTCKGLKRLLVTRLDTARRFGSVLAAAHGSNLALCHGAASAHIAGGLKEMSPTLLAALLMQYRLQT